MLLGRARAGQGARLLAAALRAHVLDPGRRRRRHLHRRQGAAAGDQPAAAHLARCAFVLFIVNIWRRGWVLPVHRRRAVGVRRGGRRRGLPGVHPALPGRSRPSRRRSGRTSSATSRRRRAALGLDSEVDTADFAADARRRARPISSADDPTLTQHAAAGTRTIVLPDVPASCRRSAASTSSTTSTSTATTIDGKNDTGRARCPRAQHRRPPAGHRGKAATSPTPTATASSAAPANTSDRRRRPDFVVQGPADRTGRPRLSNQPAVYFGENLGAYVIVDTKREEIDYQSSDDGTTQYDALQRRRRRRAWARSSAGRRSRCASATSTR